MSLKSVVPLVCATASLLFANTSRAATYAEGTTDAGDLPATAAIVSGAAGTSLTSISGTLTLTNELSESDMYEIYISDPSTFTASNTAFVAGANNFDSQLMLFDADGLGVEDNDDAASGGSQSSLPAGSAILTAGDYYLLISGSGRYATSSSGLIFPNYTDGTTDPTSTVGPTGPGGANPITGYTGNSNEGGNYVIALTGAQFIPMVPEPGAYASVLLGAAGMCLVMRARRRSAR